MASLQNRAIRGFGWMLSGTGIQAALRIVLMLVLARLLGPETFGAVGAALIVVHLAMIPSNLGISGALSQRLVLETRHIRAASWLTIAAGSLTALVMGLSAPLVQGFFDFPGLSLAILALAAAPPIAGLGIVAEGLLRRDLRFREIAFALICGHIIGYGVIGISLAVAGAGMWALIIAFIADHATRTMLYIQARPHHWLGRTDKQALGDIMFFSGGATLRRCGDQLAQVIDNIVVGRMLGAEALGIYGRAYQLVSAAPGTAGRALSHVMMPTMAKVQNHPLRLAAAYLRSIGLIAVFGLPTAALIAVLAPEMVKVLLGSEWLGVVLPLQILAGGVFLRTQLQLAEALGTAAGSVYAVAWRQGAYGVAVLVGALSGSPWGLPGVAAGVLAAQTFSCLLTTQLCLQITGMSWRSWLGAHASALFLAVMTTFCAWAAAESLRLIDAHPLLVLGAGTISAIAAAGAWLWIGRHRPESSWLIERVRERLPGRLAQAQPQRS